MPVATTGIRFDSEIGMWTVPDPAEDPDAALEREAENLDVQHRAAAVAQAVAYEVEAMTWGTGGESENEWVMNGNRLIDDISRSTAHPQMKHVVRKPRTAPHEEAVDMTSAPWGVLLATDLPLGVDWHPRDMLRLRSTCYSLRVKSTSQFYLEILAHLGVRLRPNVHDARRIFHLACRVFSELRFINSLDAAAASAVGIRRDDPDAANLCCVAGSYALNRMLLLERPVADPHENQLRTAAQRLREQMAGRGETSEGVKWCAGDIDIFVGCRGGARTRQSVALFKSLMHEAMVACHELYAGARMSYGPGADPDGITPRVQPRVKVTSDAYAGEYTGDAKDTAALGGHPAQVVDALTTHGVQYERDAVIAYSAASTFPPALARAVAALPTVVGLPRPIQVERVAEVLPFQYPFTGRATTCSFGPQWPMPMRINIIQYSTTTERGPLPPLGLLNAFDIVPARVAVKVDRSLQVRFLASEETRLAIRRRELRLTKYAFGPARDQTVAAIEEAILRQTHRIYKYEGYGFSI